MECFYLFEDKPNAPRNIRAVEVNRDYIVVAWDAPDSDGGSPITNYILEKGDTKRPGFIYTTEVKGDITEFKVTRLFEGTEYYFRVFAENQVGIGEPCTLEKAVKAKLPYGRSKSNNSERK